MDSIAITDHGAMYGVIDFYMMAKDAGIKPIIGCEVYVAETDCHKRDPTYKSPYHLTLLAKNKAGYNNLIQLATKSQLEGFYYKPRVDKDLLALHHNGLIALSGCAQGEVSRLILEEQFDEATKAASWYKEVFGDYYVEIQPHPMPELEQINRELIPLSARLNIPPVATFDVHYIDKKDAPIHDLLLCIQTNTSINDAKRMKMAGDFFYLKSPEEVEQLLSELPQAIENTQQISDMCQLEMDFTQLHLPQLSLPQGKTSDDFLAELCWQSLELRYKKPNEEIRQRLDYELEVIRKTNFADYFLVVWDIISFARKQGIYFGVRGSAAASLTLHCLGITDIDPLAYGLVFERFLNIERRELPDIDLDFQDDRRDEIIAYVNEKYGNDHVAQIITFGTLGARAALRDTGRALGMPYSQVDGITRLIPTEPTITLDKALDESQELYNAYCQDEAVHNLIDSARKLEGTIRHASTHAAGVVISRDPLTEYVPLQPVAKGSHHAVMTQFHMENIARLGLLKMDFLGLANLTILDKAKKLIEQHQESSIDLQRIPLDDAKTYQLLASGETQGIFQLESAGMRRYIKELKPTNFSDISAMVALYRPGPMEQIPTFIKAKQGTIPVHYPHQALTEILKETYGVIVYQEQVLFIAQALAGYSLGQADILRKAMGKKIHEVMKKEEKNFIARADKKGVPREIAKEVFTLIKPFAGYAFNKAHSVSYALIAYRTAYLKANYPIEYMTAFLNTYWDNMDKVRSGVAECRRLGIQVLPPDVNTSQAEFAIGKGNGKAIYFGLSAIKNVGASPVSYILSARDQGVAFKSIEDFCHRTDLRNINKKVLESLIKTGAFDSLGNRKALLESIDKIVSLAQTEQRMKESGQVGMFDLWSQSSPDGVTKHLILAPEQTGEDVSIKQKLEWERELLGVYFSQHPLDSLPSKLSSIVTVSCGEIDADMANEIVTIGGMIVSARQAYTKDRHPFIVATVEDLVSSMEVTIWPRVYDNTKDLWQEGNIVIVKGIVKIRDGRAELNCLEAQQYQPHALRQISGGVDEGHPFGLLPPNIVSNGEGEQRRLIINICQTDETEKDIERLQKVMEILKNYPGRDEVFLVIITREDTINLEIPHLTVNYCPEMSSELSNIVGDINLRFE